MSGIKTLGQFIIEKQADFSYAKGELSRLLRDIGIASKIVNREVNKAGLVDILGDAGTVNIQGEGQKKLDVFANIQFISALTSGGECCIVATEEEDDFVRIDSPVSKNAKYIVCIDPLDGSSNIDCNVAVGTIFSIYRRKSVEGEATLADVLQKGTQQVAAGYVIYGSSTMLVYTTGKGVNGFTLDPSIGEFCLSHPNMRIPDGGNIYSLNEGNYVHFPEGVKKYLKYVHVIKDNLFPIPPLFQLIQEQSGTDWKEMYKVFNMGHRMELYVPESIAQEIIAISESFNIEAQIIGRVESSAQKQVTIESEKGTFIYN
jgi:fructose-1,6-bisphosphatase I